MYGSPSTNKRDRLRIETVVTEIVDLRSLGYLGHERGHGADLLSDWGVVWSGNEWTEHGLELTVSVCVQTTAFSGLKQAHPSCEHASRQSVQRRHRFDVMISPCHFFCICKILDRWYSRHFQKLNTEVQV